MNLCKDCEYRKKFCVKKTSDCPMRNLSCQWYESIDNIRRWATTVIAILALIIALTNIALKKSNQYQKNTNYKDGQVSIATESSVDYSNQVEISTLHGLIDFLTSLAKSDEKISNIRLSGRVEK